MAKKTKNTSPINQGFMPPHDQDLEQTILGTILLETDAIHRIDGQLKPSLFYESKNMEICEAVVKLFNDSKPIDLVTVVTELKKAGKLEEVGGAHYISQLTNRIASSANFEVHFKILQELAMKRDMIRVCSSALQKSFDNNMDAFDLVGNIQDEIEKTVKGIVNHQVQSAGDIHDLIIKETIDVIKSGEKSGVPTKLALLDELTGGWQKTDLIILAGRPGMGKTSAMLSMAMNPAIEKKIPTAVFSLEMSAKQLVGRCQAQLSGVSVEKIVKKSVDTHELSRVKDKANDLKDSPLFIDDTPSITVMEFRSKARKLVKEHGVEVIFIDYLQLMKAGVKTHSREQEISMISGALKATAKELDVPIIALSQLSRSVEARGGDKRPMLSDLRESGSIEQDADMVIFCYRPEYYGFDEILIEDYEKPSDGIFFLIVAKNRNGKVGDLVLEFVHSLTKVKNHPDYLPDNFHEDETNNDNSLENPKESFTFMQPNHDFMNGGNNGFSDMEGFDGGTSDVPF